MTITKSSLLKTISIIDEKVTSLLSKISALEEEISALKSEKAELESNNQSTLDQIKEYIKELEQIRKSLVDNGQDAALEFKQEAEV